jgi:hypothetical protein
MDLLSTSMYFTVVVYISKAEGLFIASGRMCRKVTRATSLPPIVESIFGRSAI